MSNIIRAWKDEDFRANLSAEELTALPANPAGDSWNVMGDSDLRSLVGGAATIEAEGISSFRPLSCGHICTATTECPILSFCCRDEELSQL